MHSKTVFLAFAAALSLAATPSAFAADREPTFVTTAWLAKHVSDPGLVVLHAAQARADFDAGHVAGSRFVPWAAYAGPRDSLSTEMPSEARFDSLLEAAGVHDGDRLVLIGGPATTVARLLVTLDRFGVGERASIVDGGIDAWRDEGRPVVRDSIAIPPGNVTLHPVDDRVVDAAWIRAHAGRAGVAVVDARTPEFFEGASPGAMPRAGRLPGAGNAAYSWLTRDLGRYREAKDLRRIFARAGVAPGDTVVTYCHIGIQACAAYVAARSLGHDVRFYDGAFEDWSRRSELPVERGPAPDPH
ncbi:MAG: rhodanese-like domain-containing protein [Candidatus Eisenbacteria bacterium]